MMGKHTYRVQSRQSTDTTEKESSLSLGTILYVFVVILLDLYVLNPRFQSWVNYYVFVVAPEYVRYYIRWVLWSVRHVA